MNTLKHTGKMKNIETEQQTMYTMYVYNYKFIQTKRLL